MCIYEIRCNLKYQNHLNSDPLANLPITEQENLLHKSINPFELLASVGILGLVVNSSHALGSVGKAPIVQQLLKTCRQEEEGMKGVPPECISVPLLLTVKVISHEAVWFFFFLSGCSRLAGLHIKPFFSSLLHPYFSFLSGSFSNVQGTGHNCLCRKQLVIAMLLSALKLFFPGSSFQRCCLTMKPNVVLTPSCCSYCFCVSHSHPSCKDDPFSIRR